MYDAMATDDEKKFSPFKVSHVAKAHAMDRWESASETGSLCPAKLLQTSQRRLGM